jgi:hypothetical protein
MLESSRARQGKRTTDVKCDLSVIYERSPADRPGFSAASYAPRLPECKVHITSLEMTVSIGTQAFFAELHRKGD